MMKRVSGSNHDHQVFVVNMLGCVTVQEPMMLVLEYATHGDLLTYLRNSRDEVRLSVEIVWILSYLLNCKVHCTCIYMYVVHACTCTCITELNTKSHKESRYRLYTILVYSVKISVISKYIVCDSAHTCNCVFVRIHV